jgi:hypothetical protein
MNFLVCALMMAATTALELEAEQNKGTIICPKPRWASGGDKYYNGLTNDKTDIVPGGDFTIAFTLGRIFS